MNQTTLVIEREELKKIKALVDDALNKYDEFTSVEFLTNLPLIGHRMPERIVRFLAEFKYAPPTEGYRIVKGFEVDEDALGPTPAHWQLPTNNETCKDSVMTMCLWSSILGDMFGWLTQQDGRLIHDVLPIEGHQHEQLGSGSREELCMHTEDAFHELRGDYIMLMCLRNPDGIPTTLSRPDYSKLEDWEIDTLFERAFYIRPDNSHKKQNESEARSADRRNKGLSYIDRAYEQMAMRDSSPTEVSVLFGNKVNPYLRIDPYFMETPKTQKAEKALNSLVGLIEEATIEVALAAGDCIFIDNYVTVHGRRPFKARFDGTDRWIKRLNVVRDIRKYNKVLESETARVIY